MLVLSGSPILCFKGEPGAAPSFLLVLGVSHVSYSFFAIAVAIIKIYNWRTWETMPSQWLFKDWKVLKKLSLTTQEWGVYQLLLFTTPLTHGASTELLFGSFVSAANSGTHQLPLTYDFHKYMLRSMEEEFCDIVGISVPLWIFVIVCVFLSFHGTNIYFWISFFPAILAAEIMDSSPLEGFHQFNLRDELFWFGKPRFLLQIAQFISFQNAFEMATYIWSM